MNASQLRSFIMPHSSGFDVVRTETQLLQSGFPNGPNNEFLKESLQRSIYQQNLDRSGQLGPDADIANYATGNVETYRRSQYKDGLQAEGMAEPELKYDAMFQNVGNLDAFKTNNKFSRHMAYRFERNEVKALWLSVALIVFAVFACFYKAQFIDVLPAPLTPDCHRHGLNHGALAAAREHLLEPGVHARRGV